MGPPRIMFDDGSRIMRDGDERPAAPAPPPSSARDRTGDLPLRSYYEVDRVAHDVVDALDWSTRTSRGRILRTIEMTAGGNGVLGDGEGVSVDDDGFLCRVALQFPDELLSDAAEVSWLMEMAVARACEEKLMSASPLRRGIFSSGVNGNEAEVPPMASGGGACSLVEEHLSRPPLVFVLGDTTYGSCCSDEVSASHLNAEVLVHYGDTCLSPAESIPVVYAFGVSSIDDDGGKVWKECARLASDEVRKEFLGNGVDADCRADAAVKKSCRKELLVLYELRYHHAIDQLKSEFERTGDFCVVLGAIPKQQLAVCNRNDPIKYSSRCEGGDSSCRSGNCGLGAESPPEPNANDIPGCSDGQPRRYFCEEKGLPCHANGSGKHCEPASSDNPPIAMSVGKKYKCSTEDGWYEADDRMIPRTIGGLEIPEDLELSQQTLLYVGDNLSINADDAGATRLLHILLRCGAPDGPHSIWSYSPARKRLDVNVLTSPLSPYDSTTTSTALSRILRRRYFLINKAKLATTIAILIGTTNNSYVFRILLERVRRRIRSSGRTAYTLAVGKLSSSPSKLANFPEIDCFVLIACDESMAKFWRMEREELTVPVLTPLEMDVALGQREWDGRYSCDFGDLVRWDEEDKLREVEEGVDDGEGSRGPGQACGGEPGERNNEGYVTDKNDDEPFFSLISGRYEQSKTTASTPRNAMGSAGDSSDLSTLPGGGKIVEYHSEAAEFLQNREYRGLEANVGRTEARAATAGRAGIASDYGEGGEWSPGDEE